MALYDAVKLFVRGKWQGVVAVPFAVLHEERVERTMGKMTAP